MLPDVSNTMEPEKFGITTFLKQILIELSLPGKFAAFFATILLLWGIASPNAVKLLAGIALLFFALSNYYWCESKTGVSSFGEVRPWYSNWGSKLLAGLFLILFVIACYYWLRLPEVQAFLKTAGIMFTFGRNNRAATILRTPSYRPVSAMPKRVQELRVVE